MVAIGGDTSPANKAMKKSAMKSMKSARGAFDPCSATAADTLAFYGSNASSGLSEGQVEALRAEYGTNELAEEEGKSLFELIKEQFEDQLVKILLAAAGVSFLLAYFDDASAEEGWAAYVEPLVILLILIANAIVGVAQEKKADNALEALKKLQPDTAHVLRNGAWTKLEASELVPGDVVELRTGDRVPADMRIVALKTTTLRIEQSSLTGESQSVVKDADPVVADDIQGKHCIVFSSTAVSMGSCICVVVATGMSTEIGKVQSAVKEAAEDDEKTPLQQKLDDFGDLLAKVIAVICLIVWAINWSHFFDPVHGSVLRGCIYYFKIAVALAVAAIPEGLPAVITTCLAMGTQKMARRNCIVRKLPSVETLGCTTVICSDKTGTLTTNEMVAVRLALPVSNSDVDQYEVDGHSYAPIGDIDGGRFTVTPAAEAFARCGALCNESRIDVNEEGRFIRTGEPTEAAIRVLVEKMGCRDARLQKALCQKKNRSPQEAQGFSDFYASKVQKVATLEFTRDRKSMSVMCRPVGASSNALFAKGAPEGILERCNTVMLPDGSVANLTQTMRKKIQKAVERLAGDALRTLAMAEKTSLPAPYANYDGSTSHPAHKKINPDNFVSIETDMCFLGLVGIHDPPRPECRGAIEECRTAGISVIMITGDNQLTAEAIATNLGILQPEDDLSQKSFTGADFGSMSETQRVKVLANMISGRRGGGVFSRTEPRDKQAIVKILSQLGEITAMTGDGVNDAPALKQASIGVAMGIAGTEVAKEASDMVLADDNFSTIVHAVEEGRSIYNNMKAFIRYLISSNIGEVASIFFTAALGIPEGLIPVQLLWVNLVTDGPPATALGFNPPDVDAMRKPPRRRDDMLISGWVFFRYMVIGIYVGFATVGIFVYYYTLDTLAPDQHTLVTFEQLTNWGKCASGEGIWKGFTAKSVDGVDLYSNPCDYFQKGKLKASTLSLSVLVVIEMLNALNALSEDGSLLQMPPWKNPVLILAVIGATGIHMIILYIRQLNPIFSVVPLDKHDWMLVLAFSFPVILIDEVLKLFGRLTAETTRSKVVDTKKLQ
ncbi:unnamed protein product [Amoebophrya sp. A25]|nr:unnamed protein product [Amoebophrya sp. A25]|eukprot:GSA25T00004396001.1